MLAHSPHLPLIIDYLDEDRALTAEDEQGIVLALQHRNRISRIRLVKPALVLQRLILGLDGEYPNLEYLYIMPQRYQRPTIKHNRNLGFPETFWAPHLRYLVLMNFAIPMRSPLLMAMGSLVDLSLSLIPSSAYFHPNALLQQLLLMPQLEGLGITFNSHFPSGDIGRQLLRTPITTHVTLPSLRGFGFQGASAYLEAFLPRVVFPVLEQLQVYFFNQLTYSIPHLGQFMRTMGNLRVNTATLTFGEESLDVMVFPRKGARLFSLNMVLGGRHLDWQVASIAQVFHALGTVFSAVEHLTLQYDYDRYLMSSEWNNEADRTQWCELLGSLGNVKTLVVVDFLVGQLSRSLQPGEGELNGDLLPELQELLYLDASHNAFSEFIDVRRKAGRPVNAINSHKE